MILVRRSNGQPTVAAADWNAAMLSAPFIPVSINAHLSPLWMRYTLTMVGFIGSGRCTRKIPGATSRTLASITLRPLPEPSLVQPVLDGECQLDPHAPARHGAVLDIGADVPHLGAPDALDRHRRPRHGEVDGHFDAVHGPAGERNGFLDHGLSSPDAARCAASLRTL